MMTTIPGAQFSNRLGALSAPKPRNQTNGPSTSYTTPQRIPFSAKRSSCSLTASSRRNILQLAICASAANNRGDLRAQAVETAVQYEMSSVTISVSQESTAQVSCGPPAFVKATGRIIAIGDIHGDLPKALACLEMAGVLAEEDGHVKWVGEDTTVVQLGDVLDRGDSEISTILLLRELDRQAREDGGAVYMLNGNHESLNVAGDFRYVTPGAFWESAIAAGLRDHEIAAADKQTILKARWKLYKPGGQMARELARNPTVLVVNDIVFAHGGLLPHHVKYGIQRINDEVANWMNGGHLADGSAPTPPFPAMGDANSVMWNRTFGKERLSPYDRMQIGVQLKATLSQLQARAMVVGHTPQMAGVNAECDGRVWRVDAGMSSGVLGAEPQILEFTKDKNGEVVARLIRGTSTSIKAGQPDAMAA